MAARTRHDPASKPADGRMDSRIRQQDPNRHYVWTNPADQDTGTDSYMQMGYEVERHGPDAPKTFGGRKIGDDDAIMFKGQVLVSCPIGDYAEREGVGQAQIDALDRKILKRGSIEDGLRGPGLEVGIDMKNTSAPVEELGV